MIEDIGEPAADTPPSHEVEKEDEPVDDMPEISFHAIAGANHPQTLQVIGTLRNKPITVLIDSGSFHNFIDQNVVTHFGLPIEKGKQLQVMVANKDRIKCSGQCKALAMNIQGCFIITDYYVFPVAACPLFLACNG